MGKKGGVITLVLSMAIILNGAMVSSQSLETLIKPQLLKESNCVDEPLWYTFYSETEANQIVNSLTGQSFDAQSSYLQTVFSNQAKMFTINQIISVLNTVQQNQQQGRAQLLFLLKPFIPKMTSEQGVQLLSVIPDVGSTIALSTIIQMICDLNSENKDLFMNSFSYPVYYLQNYFQVYVSKLYHTFISTEGSYAAFLLDSSNSMFEPVTASDGTVTTRWNYVQQFLYRSNDLNANVDVGFYTLFSANNTIIPASTFSHSSWNSFQKSIQWKNSGDGETDIISALAQVTQFPNDGLTDIFIVTDGIITSGSKDIGNAVQLIQARSLTKRPKVRINTIQIYVGPTQKETPDQVGLATATLKVIASYGGGTYLSVNA